MIQLNSALDEQTLKERMFGYRDEAVVKLLKPVLHTVYWLKRPNS